MPVERIEFNPKLKHDTKCEFIAFCKKIVKETKKLDSTKKFEYHVQLRTKLIEESSGPIPDAPLLFCKNILVDLLLIEWKLIIKKEDIFLEHSYEEEERLDIVYEKFKTRRIHELSRDMQLRESTVIEFVKGMERRRLSSDGWHSVFSLMRDGEKLAKDLKNIVAEADDEAIIAKLENTIKPYIQFVEPEKRCERTGLLLTDIWRYFRHTWTNEYKSLPGRSLWILIRDAAVPTHPVIGIAALGSSVAQQSCRDKWIGWDGEAFFQNLKSDPSLKYATWLIQKLNELLNEIYLKDLFKDRIISLKDITHPTTEIIKKLKELSVVFKKKHINNPKSAKFIVENDTMSWEDRAKTDLYKSKRLSLLAEMLSIKLVFDKYDFKKPEKDKLQQCLLKTDFRDAVQKLARKVKATHVGINMMDVIVCGAIAPYNHLIGGKLVCMLLASPEVSNYYNLRYSSSVSLIASSMKGEEVIRRPQLVLLGTTSLYGAGSSQYNRIKVPGKELGGAVEERVEYKNLGFSEGFGSFHFNRKTLDLADTLVGIIFHGRRNVNSIFGEGANPLLRKVRVVLEHLGLNSTSILNHRNKRVVYGVPLASNFREVLMDIDKKAKYIIPQSKASYRTELISKYWIKRWLVNRIKNEKVINDVESHVLDYPITHGAKVNLKAADESEEILLLF